MKKPAIQKTVSFGVLMLFLASCGGGGSTGGDTVAEGGIDGTGIVNPGDQTGAVIASVGEITAFGSIFVNGVKYEVDDAIIQINDNTEATESELKLGMIVRVTGSRNVDGLTGTATGVIFDKDIEGPIGAVVEVNDTTKTVLVLGRLVTVTDGIVFEGVDFDTLAEGQMVEVSGLMGTAGTLLATRIELIAEVFTPGANIETEGEVTSVDISTQTFVVNSLVVDYSSAELKGFGDDAITAGQFVEAKGTSFNDSGALIAKKVSLESGSFGVDEGDEFEIEGIVSGFDSIANFTVSGQQVNAESATFSDGSPDDVQEGVRVEVEGTIDGDNVLQADKVKIKLETNITVESLATEVDIASDSLTLMGVEVVADENTRFQDNSAAKNRFFSLSDIMVDDFLSVRAVQVGDIIKAIRIERKRNARESSLKGPISSISGNEIVIAGVTVDVSGAEGNELLSALSVGDTVKVKGEETGDKFFQAREIERDD